MINLQRERLEGMVGQFDDDKGYLSVKDMVGRDKDRDRDRDRIG